MAGNPISRWAAAARQSITPPTAPEADERYANEDAARRERSAKFWGGVGRTVGGGYADRFNEAVGTLGAAVDAGQGFANWASQANSNPWTAPGQVNTVLQAGAQHLANNPIEFRTREADWTPPIENPDLAGVFERAEYAAYNNNPEKYVRDMENYYESNPQRRPPRNALVGFHVEQELSPEEWQGLDARQQQAVVANQLLQQAAATDRRDRTGLTTEARDQALTDLGVTKDDANYEDLLGLNKFLDYDTVLNGGERVDMLADLPVFSDQRVVDALAQGQALISTLRNPEIMSEASTSQLPANTTAREQLQEQEVKELDEMLLVLANRDNWQQMQTDPEYNAFIGSLLEDTFSRYDPSLVAQYVNELGSLGSEGTGSYFSLDEFRQNWWGGQ